MIEGILQGLEVALSLSGFLSLVCGVVVGIIVGVLPGLGPVLGMALLLPFTYDLGAANAVIMLLSVYVGAEYGGAITSILLAVPGNAAAAATVLDGNPLAKQGRAGFALEVSLVASCIGGLFSGFVALLFLDSLKEIVLTFGPPTIFALALLALTSIGSLGGGSPVKGLFAALLGLAIATVGADKISGMPRFTFGISELYEGFELVPVVIGLFAIAEILEMLHPGQAARAPTQSMFARMSWADWKLLSPAMLRGSVVGTIAGILPGMGANIGAWLAYDLEKRVSKTPERFGKGAPEGVAAPEAANNSAVGGALVPLLALGLPSTGTTAILIGALIMHGVQPGPRMVLERPEVAYGLLATVIISIVVMYILGRGLIPLWVRIAMVPASTMAAIVLVLCVLGAYSTRNLMFDVWVALAFGALGYLMRLYKIPVPPLILGLVLYSIVESNFRRSLLMSNGNLSIFSESVVTVIVLAATALVIVIPIVRRFWPGRSTVSKEI